MKNLFTLKTLFLTTVFMLFCCLSIQAADDELITNSSFGFRLQAV